MSEFEQDLADPVRSYAALQCLRLHYAPKLFSEQPMFEAKLAQVKQLRADANQEKEHQDSIARTIKKNAETLASGGKPDWDKDMSKETRARRFLEAQIKLEGREPRLVDAFDDKKREFWFSSGRKSLVWDKI